MGEAHRWLRRHNGNVHSRIAGYLALGRKLDFVYPWPVVAVLSADDTLNVAIQQMWQLNIRHLPVVDQGSLLGMVSERDVLLHIARGLSQQQVARVLREAMANE